MWIDFVNHSMQKVIWYVDASLSEYQFDRFMKEIIEAAVSEYHSNRDRKEEEVRYLYDVRVVLPDESIVEGSIVATSEDNAKFKMLREVLEEGQDPDDVDIFVGKVGALKNREG